jgi:Protein involved in initiation of plasmid replication
MNSVRRQRDYNVTKSNELIQSGKFDLSLIEQKIILTLIQKILPTDKEFQTYEFSIQDFCEICGIDRQNGKSYINCKNAIKSLHSKNFWIQKDKKEYLCSWVSKAIIEKDSGIIEIRLDEDLRPYLLELKKNFTSYSLFYILGMKSKYSIRLYEILKSYEYKNRARFDIDELKLMLCATNYTKWSDFKRYVIDSAIKEINEYTDINIEYSVSKKGRKIQTLNFFIELKELKEMLQAYIETEKVLYKE